MALNVPSSVCTTDNNIINPALILIPDISGFTNFIARADLEHSQWKIAQLLMAILDNNVLGLSVSEIEGDAILFYRFNDTSTFHQIIEQCSLMFERFHEKLGEFRSESNCKCRDCIFLQQLTLKFIVHYGDLGSVMIKKYCKLFGMELIVAHRLMKNSIPHDEYILFTEAFKFKYPIGNIHRNYNVINEVPTKLTSRKYEAIGRVSFEYLKFNSKKILKN